MRVVVISTGWRSPLASVCRASVATQVHPDFDVRHIYVEASVQVPVRTKMQNLVETIATLDQLDVVALVDGDDHLAHREALMRVVREHRAGALVTYGSFVQSDGKPGFAAPYETPEYRREPWKATHLKTFRAGLFQRIKPEDLHYRGAWIDRGDDPAFTFPCLEMAGRDRVRFVEEIIYVYSAELAWETTVTADERQHELDIVNEVRKRRPYARLESL